MVDTASKNYLTIALEEVATGKVAYSLPLGGKGAVSHAAHPSRCGGGIAAYKALEFTRLAMKAGHSVRVADGGVHPSPGETASFAGITGAPVLVTGGSRTRCAACSRRPTAEHAPLSHLALVERADVFLVAPATAETLAKLASGLADNLLDGGRAGLPATAIVGSAAKEQRDVRASGHAGQPRDVAGARGDRARAGRRTTRFARGVRGGAASEPPALLEAVEGVLAGGASLRGVSVLVSAGGTREPIDAVRFIGNRSLGPDGVRVSPRRPRWARTSPWWRRTLPSRRPGMRTSRWIR